MKPPRETTPGFVSRAAAARVIEQLIADRNDDDGVHGSAGAGGAMRLADECHAGMPDVPRSTFEKTIYVIRTGKARRRNGDEYVRRAVGFDVVDKILTACGRTDLWYGQELRRWGMARQGVTQPRRYQQLRPESKMTLADISAAHELYLEGKSLRALGRELWERYGYASPRSCANSLSEAFIRESLPTRNRIDAMVAASTKHGMSTRAKQKANTLDYRVLRKRRRRANGEARGVVCKGITQTNPRCIPRPCRRAALAGGDYCVAHDPDRRPALLAVLADARARINRFEVAA